jgi:DNA-binding NtrC family response regulator
VENKPGRFKLAHNGTLFLTEIGDLPLTLQVKLLTFLDDQVIYPLGSTKGFQADVRVVAGTHRDLEGMVREGRFRQDLLFRLNVVRVHLPPLRDRGEDIRLLLDHFLNRFSEKFNKGIEGYAKTALTLLTRYDYPGNVRELRNIVEYAVNVCDGPQIAPTHLPAYLSEEREGTTGGEEREGAAVSGSRPALSGVQSGAPEETWADVERRMIIDALVQAGGKRTRAAEILGWGRSTLWRKIKQHGIDTP